MMFEAFKKYAVFTGRANRSEYWLFVLVMLVLSFLIGFIDGMVGLDGGLLVIFLLALIIPNISVTFRRLHDTDRSAWWMLLSFIPLGNFVLIIFLCFKGTEGPNRYGDDPLSSYTEQV